MSLLSVATFVTEASFFLDTRQGSGLSTISWILFWCMVALSLTLIPVLVGAFVSWFLGLLGCGACRCAVVGCARKRRRGNSLMSLTHLRDEWTEEVTKSMDDMLPGRRRGDRERGSVGTFNVLTTAAQEKHSAFQVDSVVAIPNPLFQQTLVEETEDKRNDRVSQATGADRQPSNPQPLSPQRRRDDHPSSSPGAVVPVESSTDIQIVEDQPQYSLRRPQKQARSVVSSASKARALIQRLKDRKKKLRALHKSQYIDDYLAAVNGGQQSPSRDNS